MAAPQVRVRAALLVQAQDELPLAVVARTERDLRELLEGSGRYLFVDEIALQARTGEEGPALLARCGEDEVCWAQLTHELAVTSCWSWSSAETQRRLVLSSRCAMQLGQRSPAAT